MNPLFLSFSQINASENNVKKPPHGFFGKHEIIFVKSMHLIQKN